MKRKLINSIIFFSRSAIASAALIGAVIGQFSFGYLGNILGIEYGLALTLLLCIVNVILFLFFIGW